MLARMLAKRQLNLPPHTRNESIDAIARGIFDRLEATRLRFDADS